MRAQADSDAGVGSSYVSTGHLPPAERVQALVAAAHARFAANDEGANSRSTRRWPRCRRDLFGVCVVGAERRGLRRRRRRATSSRS